MEGEFVVFLIGMRTNKPWKVHNLQAHPEASFLGHNG